MNLRRAHVGQSRPPSAGLAAAQNSRFWRRAAILVGEAVQNGGYLKRFADHALWNHRQAEPRRSGGNDAALGLALGFHGLADEAVERIILDEVGQSIRWVRRSGRLLAFAPNDSPFARQGQESYIDSPVPEAVQVADRLRAGAPEQTRDFAPVHGFLLTLMESGGHLIDWPG
jgi:hypothetical protein